MTFRTAPRRKVNVEARTTGVIEHVDFQDAYVTTSFNTAFVYLPFVLQGGSVAQIATLEYRTPAGSGSWIPYFNMEKTVSATWGSMLSGVVTDLLDDTEYEFRITVAATGGTHQTTVIATTREDAIESHASLLARATHFVRLDGSDANAGTADTTGGAWRTVRKAHLSAPTDAVVKVGTGVGDQYFEWSGAVETAPLRSSLGGVSFVAPFPPVGDDGVIIGGNVGKRTIIEGNVRGAPTVTTDHVTRPWVETELTGPITGDTITVWKWTGAKGATDRLNAMCYGATRAENMKVMWHHDWQSNQNAAPEEWADIVAGDEDSFNGNPVRVSNGLDVAPLRLNMTWHWGYYYQDGSPDVYLLMPTDASGDAQDPNDFYWTTHGGDGFSLACPDSRVSGFVVRCGRNGVYANQRADRLIIDHNWFQNVYTGVRTNGQPVTSSTPYSSDIVVEHNLTTMRGLRRAPGLTQAQEPVAPWGAVKQEVFLTARGITRIPVVQQTLQVGGPNDGKFRYGIKDPLGSGTNRKRLLGRMEGHGIRNSGSRRTVYRHNVVDGLFDGFGGDITLGTTQYTEDRFSNAESDCHHNTFRNLGDDPYEPAHACPNIVFRDNDIEYTISGMSTAGPTAWGPIYYLRNRLWRVSCSTSFGMQPNEDGSNSTRRGDQNAYWFKYDGAVIPNSPTRPQARMYVIGNTFWSDDTRAHGGEPAAGAGNIGQKFYKRNNIERLAIDFMDFFGPARGGYDADYSAYAAANTAARFRRNSSQTGEALVIYGSFAAYQAAGYDTHSNTVGMGFANEFDVTHMDAQFEDPTAGDLRLKVASVLRDVGVNTPLRSSGAVDLGYQANG